MTFEYSTITIPNTTIFSHLMKRLFSVRVDNCQLDHGYDVNRNKPPTVSDALIRQSVFEKARNLFKLHGAVMLDTPLLSPSATLSRLYPQVRNKENSKSINPQLTPIRTRTRV